MGRQQEGKTRIAESRENQLSRANGRSLYPPRRNRWPGRTEGGTKLHTSAPLQDAPEQREPPELHRRASE